MTEFWHQSNRYNHWIISIAVLFIIFVVGIARISAQNVKHAADVGQCNIDADKAFLSVQYDHDYYLELGNLGDKTRLVLTEEGAGAEWFADGEAFIFYTFDSETRYTLELFDVATNQVTFRAQSPSIGDFSPSPDGRYMLHSLLKSGLPSSQNTVFDRVANEIVFDERLEFQVFVGWSPQGRYMTYRGVEGGIDAIFDITVNQYLDLPFLNQATKIVGWVDDEHFVYRNEDGELMTYTLQSHQSENHVEGVYPSDWLTSGNLYPYNLADQWIGMKDDEDRLWIIDIVNQNRVDIGFVDYLYGDISIVGDVLYMSDYNFPEQIEIIELRNEHRITLDFAGTRYPPVSQSGYYFATSTYVDRDRNLYVEDFRTGERVDIELPYHTLVFDYFYWIQVDDQDYLYYVQPKDDNPAVYRHFLYHPETQNTCIATESQYERLVWQP